MCLLLVNSVKHRLPNRSQQAGSQTINRLQFYPANTGKQEGLTHLRPFRFQFGNTLFQFGDVDVQLADYLCLRREQTACIGPGDRQDLSTFVLVDEFVPCDDQNGAARLILFPRCTSPVEADHVAVVWRR